MGVVKIIITLKLLVKVQEVLDTVVSPTAGVRIGSTESLKKEPVQTNDSFAIRTSPTRSPNSVPLVSVKTKGTEKPRSIRAQSTGSSQYVADNYPVLKEDDRPDGGR